jgi:Uma2 family endonuclease
MATAPDIRPELESGDRLTREEFHRRYEARPDIWKAELIDGVVYLGPQRVSFTLHGQPCALMAAWLGMHIVDKPDLSSAIRPSIFLSDDSEVQPDVILIHDPRLPHATVRYTDDGYLEGTPELVAEIAASSASYDLHDKKEAYRRAGVLEYIAWRVLDEAID